MGSWPEPASSLMKRPPPWTMFFERCWNILPKILRTWSQAATLKKSWALYSRIQGPHEKGTVINTWFAFASGLLLSCHPIHWWCVQCSLLRGPQTCMLHVTLGFIFLCHPGWRILCLLRFYVLVESCPYFITMTHSSVLWGEKPTALECLVCLEPLGVVIPRQVCALQQRHTWWCPFRNGSFALWFSI